MLNPVRNLPPILLVNAQVTLLLRPVFIATPLRLELPVFLLAD